MRAELRSRRHRSAGRASSGLGQRRCWGAVPSAGPIVTRAGQRAPDRTAVLPHGSPPCPAPCTGLWDSRPTVGHSCERAPRIALGSKVASDRDTVPLGGPSPSCTQGDVPAPSQRCRGMTRAVPTESLFTVYRALHRAPGYPRLVVCSSSADKSEVSFLN